MSDDLFDFDFHKLPMTHPGLDYSSAAYLADAMVSPEGSRERAIAALAAARTLVAHDIAPGTRPETQEALSALVNELEHIEYTLRDLEDGVKPTGLTAPSREGGRPPESNAVIDFQVRAIMAVKWLQQLETGALTKTAAVSAVAKVIPRTLLQTQAGQDGERRGGTLKPEEQLAAWLDKSHRRGSRQHGRLLELWYVISVERYIPMSRQTSAQVVAWLQSERSRLLRN
jgi:hypothetical protein